MASLTLCKALNAFGVSWRADDTILFGQGAQGISQVPAGGGEPKVIITVDSKKGEYAYGPQLLASGRSVLFTLASTSPQATSFSAWDQADIVVQSLGSGAQTGGINFGGAAAGTGAAQFAVSSRGLLTYVEREAADASARALVWVDRQGHETPIRMPPRAYTYPRISPDEHHLAVDIRDQDQDVWVPKRPGSFTRWPLAGVPIQ